MTLKNKIYQRKNFCKTVFTYQTVANFNCYFKSYVHLYFDLKKLVFKPHTAVRSYTGKNLENRDYFLQTSMAYILINYHSMFLNN